MARSKKYVISLLVTVFALLLPVHPVVAQGKIACPASKTDAKYIGKLRVAGLATQIPSVQWGIDNGCYKKYGISIQSEVVATSQIATAGLIGGSYDVITINPTGLFLVNANEGFNGVIVAPRHGYLPEELIRAKIEPFYPGELLMQSAVIARPNSGIRVNNWADLEGKKVAIQSFAGADHIGVASAMSQSGADYKKTEFLVLSSQQMVEALKRGDIDAGVIQEPFATTAVLAGNFVAGYHFAYYAQAGYLGDTGVALVYASNAKAVKKNTKAMRAFQRATLEINRLLNQPEHDASFRQTYQSVAGVTPAAAAKIRLPKMIERNLTIYDVSYIPTKLFNLGFTRVKIKTSPVIFK